VIQWLLLHYKLPPEPSALRVYVWRKLKRLGAVLFQDAVWLLPLTPRTQEQFQWLATEIVEMGGEAALWEAHPSLAGKNESLVEQFQEQVNQGYNEILNQVGQPDPDLEALSRQYQQIRPKDYFQAPLGKQVRDALQAARGAQS
jgi:hypothetical protein